MSLILGVTVQITKEYQLANSKNAILRWWTLLCGTHWNFSVNLGLFMTGNKIKVKINVKFQIIRKEGKVCLRDYSETGHACIFESHCKPFKMLEAYWYDFSCSYLL